MKNLTFTLALVALTIAWGVLGCGDDSPDLATQRSGLTVWDISRSHSDAEDLVVDYVVDELTSLSTSVQSCLDSEGVSSSTITSSCSSTPRQIVASTPYETVDGDQIAAHCVWDCTAKVPTKGISYGSITILQTYQTPSEVSGGCP